jgi:hypothetical protein
VDRLPPGRQCAESDDDERALAAFMEAIEQAQSLDGQSVRNRAATRTTCWVMTPFCFRMGQAIVPSLLSSKGDSFAQGARRLGTPPPATRFLSKCIEDDCDGPPTEVGSTACCTPILESAIPCTCLPNNPPV